MADTDTPSFYVKAKDIRENSRPHKLRLRSHVAIVFDERDNEIIFSRNSDMVMPVASLSKLMTAMVILDANLPMDEKITINRSDKDRIRWSRSRLKYGMQFSRDDLLRITLAASENRAAMALARTFPGGRDAFVQAMNTKAQSIGLKNTHFMDPAGLHDKNVSTANELIKLVRLASNYPVIRSFTTQTKDSIFDSKTGREIKFGNTNLLVKRDSWPISLSKTGYTSVAGNCLVMQTEINTRPVIIVLLESWGKWSKYGDSNRIKNWLINTELRLEKRIARNHFEKVNSVIQ
ncbi:MAG: D-alanyl-D-alanine endopeptidase [Gammaproteobacteria bacterium]|nr:D-alanyl-D-alanine endopeptidase [Gammaproteobacteria bacterium]